MSELNDVVEEVVSDATVMTVPIDDTLSVSGEAADAKAVGDALALKADASSVVDIDVNGQSADNQGHIIIDGTDIKMSSTDQTTLKEKIEAVDGKTGADIAISGDVGAQTVKAAVEAVADRTATDIPMSSSNETPIASKIASMDTAISANSTAASAANARTAQDIPMTPGGTKKIADAIDECVKSVNGETPDETGNVQVQHALTADNLTSAASQSSVGEWTRRTSGGSASISDGNAWLSSVRGNRVHVGYVEEVLNMTLTTAPREEGETPITATIDHDTFVAAASGSGTYNFVYTTSWSVSPATYGITVTGTPVSGDQIVVSYTAEDRGTIIQSDPQSLVSTGWNLYDNTKGYAIGLKYDADSMFKIEGTYTAVKYSSTLTGDKSTITPTDGYFTIPANGYIWVTGGNATDTAIYMTWSDWLLEGPSSWEGYEEDVIDLSTVMETYFPNGLLRVGDVRDEIDFNTGLAISNVQRLAYSAENLAQAVASGRTYECDTDYIYLERAVAVANQIELDGQYEVNDHGLEYFTDTDISVYAVVIYGNNLKNKLERDVVTKSQDLVNNLTTNDSTKALSAAQGYALNGNITALDGSTLKRLYTNYSSTAKTHTISLSDDWGLLILIYYWGGSDSSKTGMYMTPMSSGTVTSAIVTIKSASGVTLTLSNRTLTVEVANPYTSVVVVGI